MTSYGTVSLQEQESANPKEQLAGLLSGGQAASIAGTNLTVDELMGQLGLIPQSLTASTNYGNLEQSQAKAQAALGQEQLGLQGQGLQAQAGLLGTQYGIQQQTLAGQEQLAATQYGLSQQEIAAQKAQQAQAYGNQVENTAGGLAAQGAGNTQGAKQQIATNAFQNQQAQSAINRQQIGEQAQYGFQQQQFGLQQQGEAAQQQYSLGDIARGEAGLNLTAQQNGLSLQQTIDQMQYGMSQAGLQAQQDTGQLYGQIGSAIAQGDQYQAGALGAASLLGGGLNTNQMWAGPNGAAEGNYTPTGTQATIPGGSQFAANK